MTENQYFKDKQDSVGGSGGGEFKNHIYVATLLRHGKPSLWQPRGTLYVAVTHTPLSKLVGWQMKWKLSSEVSLSSSLASLCDSHHSLAQVAPHLQRPQAGVPGEP